MPALQLILADGVTIKLGDNVWTFGLNFIIGGGLVSLFGTWIATVRHPHYLRLGE